MDGNNDVLTSGEAMRQIHSLWERQEKIENKLNSLTIELAMLNPKIVHIAGVVDRIERAQQESAPTRAIQGARIEAVEACAKEIRPELNSLRSDVETLLASNRIMKWILGVVTGILVVVGAEKFLDTLGRH